MVDKIPTPEEAMKMAELTNKFIEDMGAILGGPYKVVALYFEKNNVGLVTNEESFIEVYKALNTAKLSIQDRVMDEIAAAEATKQ